MEIRKLKRITSILLAVILVLGVTATGFAGVIPEEEVVAEAAEELATPQAEDIKIAVTGIDAGVTATAEIFDSSSISVGTGSVTGAGDIDISIAAAGTGFTGVVKAPGYNDSPIAAFDVVTGTVKSLAVTMTKTPDPQKNFITVVDEAGAPKGGVAVTTGSTTTNTDANGSVRFDGLADGEHEFTTEAGLTIGTTKYLASSTKVTVVSGNFEPIELVLRVAPELSKVVLTGVKDQVAASGKDVKFEVTATAAGANVLPKDFAYQWQFRKASDADWTDIANDANEAKYEVKVGDTIGSKTVEAGDVFRVLAWLDAAGYKKTDVIDATGKVLAANCISTEGRILTAPGYNVSGFVYNTAGGIVEGGAAADVLKVWKAEDYNVADEKLDEKAIIDDLQVKANGSYALSTKDLVDGNYVIGLKPLEGDKSYTFTGGKFYGGVANFTVKGADVTGVDIRFAPVPAVVFTTNLKNVTALDGTSATFTVVTDPASPTATYQWYEDTGRGMTLISGETNATYTKSTVNMAMTGYKYQVEVTVGTTEVTVGTTKVKSDIATLTVVPDTDVAIVVQPKDVTTVEKGTATFEVRVAGDDTVTYAWEVDRNIGSFVPFIGGTITPLTEDIQKGELAGESLLIPAAQSINKNWNGYKFRVVVKKGSDIVATSEPATLTVVEGKPVSIEKNPVDTTAVLNRYADFEATVGGTGAYTAEWQFSTNKGITFTSLGASAPQLNTRVHTLSVPVNSESMAGNQYRLYVRDTATATELATAAASITAVTKDVVAPSIAKNPVNVTVAEGRPYSFGVEAAGTGPFMYAIQTSTDNGKTWTPTDSYLRSAPITDSNWKDTNVVETASAVKGPDKMFKFAVKEKVVSGISKVVFSEAALLHVTDVVAPTITTQPADFTSVVGGTAEFAVALDGTGPFAFVWQKSLDGRVWQTVGAQQTLTLDKLAKEDDGAFFRVRVKTVEGKYVMSDVAKLTVLDSAEGIVIEGNTSVYPGEKIQLRAIVSPEDADVDVVWSIHPNNAHKAKVDQNGVVTALSNGYLNVTATVKGSDISTQYKISVSDKLFVNGGGLKPWYTKLNAPNSKWSTNNKGVTVDANGMVKINRSAKDRSTATVTARNENGGVKTWKFRLEWAK